MCSVLIGFLIHGVLFLKAFVMKPQ
jgi:hypothetical protein